MNNPIWQAFVDSGLVGKSIYFSLLGASIWVWTIIIHKLLILSWVRRGMESFFTQFEIGKGGKLSLTASPLFSGSELTWAVYQTGCREISKLRENTNPSSPMPPGALEKIKLKMEETAREKIGELEKYLIFLATAAAAGPLFGILGTLWGVLLAFRKMGQVGAATLDAVAPGISEALLTTVVGLAIAIPALLAYNYFNHAIARVSSRLDAFISNFLAAGEEQIPAASPEQAAVAAPAPLKTAPPVSSPGADAESATPKPKARRRGVHPERFQTGQPAIRPAKTLPEKEK